MTVAMLVRDADIVACEFERMKDKDSRLTARASIRYPGWVLIRGRTFAGNYFRQWFSVEDKGFNWEVFLAR